MEYDRVFLIGLSDAGLGIKQTELFSTENLYEANCIVWDLASIRNEMSRTLNIDLEGDNDISDNFGVRDFLEKEMWLDRRGEYNQPLTAACKSTCKLLVAGGAG